MTVTLNKTSVSLGTSSAPLIEGSTPSTFGSAGGGVGYSHGAATGRYGCRVALASTTDFTTHDFVAFQFYWTEPFDPTKLGTIAAGGRRVYFVDTSGNYAGFNVFGSGIPNYSGDNNGLADGFIAGYVAVGNVANSAYHVARGRTPDVASGTAVDWSRIAHIEINQNLVSSSTQALYIGEVNKHNGISTTGTETLSSVQSTAAASTSDRKLVARSTYITQAAAGVAYCVKTKLLIGDGATATNWTDSKFLLGFFNTYDKSPTYRSVGPLVQLDDSSNRLLKINQSASCVLALTDFSIASAAYWQWELTGSGSAALTRGDFWRFNGFSAGHGTYTDCTWDSGESAVGIGSATVITRGTVRNGVGHGIQITGAAGDYGALDIAFNNNSTYDIELGSGGAGTYTLDGISVIGSYTLKIRNDSATNAVVVEIPSGITYSTSTAGGSITVSAPGLYQSVTVTGAIANSEIQVADVSYDFTVSGVTTAPVAGDTYTNNDITWTVTATDITAGAGTITAYGLGTPETSGDLTRTTGSGDSTIEFSAWARNVTTLYKGAPTFPYTWTDGAAAAAARAIRLRVAYCQGTVAKQMIESYIGVCGVSSGDAAIAYNAAQVGDATYNTWALDGPTILAGGNYTFTDASPDLITINAASVGATLGWPTLYAVTVAWLSSDDGIDDEIAYCVSPDPVNFIWENVRIKIPVGEAMAMTSGWGRDSVTGLGITLWDSTGGAISFDGPHTTGYPSGSGLDGGQSAELTSAAANAAAIKVAVDAYLDATISSRARPADVPSANDVAQEVVAGITF